jgi:predicted metal-dependent HD superfamily phosphohydrolase
MQEMQTSFRAPVSARPSFEQLADALRDLFRAERDVAQEESRRKPIMTFVQRQKIYMAKAVRTSAMQQARVLLRDLDGSEA